MDAVRLVPPSQHRYLPKPSGSIAVEFFSTKLLSPVEGLLRLPQPRKQAPTSRGVEARPFLLGSSVLGSSVQACPTPVAAMS